MVFEKWVEENLEIDGYGDEFLDFFIKYGVLFLNVI